MKKAILLGLVLFPMMWTIPGCPSNNEETPPAPVDLTVPTPPPTDEPVVGTVPPLDRCSLYEGLEFGIVVHTISDGDTTVTTYTKFPDTVVGYGDDTFKYYGMLGNEESLECMIFEGETFKERVYCMFKITKGDYNAARHYKLMVEGCDEIIHEVPMLSLMVDEDSTSGSGSGGGPSCGAMPDPLCAGKYEDWCNCMGGTFSCIDPSIQMAICWNP